MIVDWEYLGKQGRQAGKDTQINRQDIETLLRVRGLTTVHLLCRINAPQYTSQQEIEDALLGRADEIIVPMVRTAAEVEAILRIVNEHAPVGILVETMDAVRNSRDLGQLPLSRVYVGLNDLAIDRGLANILPRSSMAPSNPFAATFPSPSALPA